MISCCGQSSKVKAGSPSSCLCIIHALFNRDGKSYVPKFDACDSNSSIAVYSVNPPSTHSAGSAI